MAAAAAAAASRLLLHCCGRGGRVRLGGGHQVGGEAARHQTVKVNKQFVDAGTFVAELQRHRHRPYLDMEAFMARAAGENPPGRGYIDCPDLHTDTHGFPEHL